MTFSQTRLSSSSEAGRLPLTLWVWHRHLITEEQVENPLWCQTKGQDNKCWLNWWVGSGGWGGLGWFQRWYLDEWSPKDLMNSYSRSRPNRKSAGVLCMKSLIQICWPDWFAPFFFLSYMCRVLHYHWHHLWRHVQECFKWPHEANSDFTLNPLTVLLTEHFENINLGPLSSFVCHIFSCFRLFNTMTIDVFAAFLPPSSCAHVLSKLR